MPCEAYPYFFSLFVLLLHHIQVKVVFEKSQKPGFLKKEPGYLVLRNLNSTVLPLRNILRGKKSVYK